MPERDAAATATARNSGHETTAAGSRPARRAVSCNSKLIAARD